MPYTFSYKSKKNIFTQKKEKYKLILVPLPLDCLKYIFKKTIGKFTKADFEKTDKR